MQTKRERMRFGARIDTVQEALACCVDYHTAKLYDVLNEISDELTRAMSGKDIHARYSFRFVLDNKTWTKGDNVGFVVSMVSGGLLSLVADGIGGAMRKKELADRKPQVIQEIKRQYDSLFVSVQRTVAEVYRKMGGQAKQHLSDFYNSKLQTLERQMEQSAAAARQDAAKKQEIRLAAGELRKVLDNIVQVV